MMKFAEALGRDFEFARIDLYLVRGKIFFGEVTHYPNAGLVPFKPREFDRVLGDVCGRALRSQANIISVRFLRNCLQRSPVPAQ